MKKEKLRFSEFCGALTLSLVCCGFIYGFVLADAAKEIIKKTRRKNGKTK